MSIGLVTNPNLVLTVSLDSTEQLINIPYAINVSVQNTGNEDAASVTVNLTASGQTISPSSRSFATIPNGSTSVAQFTVTSSAAVSGQTFTATAGYKDTDGAALADVSANKVVNISGNSIPTGSDSQLLVGGTKAQQNFNFTVNQSQTINGQSSVGANITITTTENVTSPEITIAKYSSITNGTLSGKKEAGRYVVVSVTTSFNTKISAASLKIFYQQSEVDNNNINEGTLKIFR